MLKKIDKYINTHINPQLKKKIGMIPTTVGVEEIPHIIVGFSGGPDSMFLLHYLKNLEEKFFLRLSAAHLNHGWRKESDEDEVFCKNICKKLKIPIFTGHAEQIKKRFLEHKKLPSGSKEELGRLLRRHFLQKVKKECGADYIALAHHQQDQQETFFIRLIRGCSLSGLTSIKPVQDNFVRPLLKTSKEEIVSFLEKNKIEYLIDATNESEDFLRNRIRKFVIPALKKTDPRFDKKFETSLESLEQEHNLLQSITQEAFNKSFTKGEKISDTYVSNRHKFCDFDLALQKRLLIRWLCLEKVPFSPSTRFLKEIINFLVSNRGGSHQMNQTWLIKKQQQNFWIEKLGMIPTTE